jgi:glutaredoxin-like YruB-family protein
MKLEPVGSYRELERGITGTERAFLLLYKGGSDQSECALQRISEVEGDEETVCFTADVSSVRDIHERIGVNTAPSLVLFVQGRAVNIYKGCQTGSTYTSILEGKEIGSVPRGEGKKPKQVTVYTTPTCSWCTTLKTYLDEHRVRYREINVASDTSAAEALVRKSGQQGVPQTEIDGQIIVGFDKSRINQLLEIK